MPLNLVNTNIEYVNTINIYNNICLKYLGKCHLFYHTENYTYKQKNYKNILCHEVMSIIILILIYPGFTFFKRESHLVILAGLELTV